MDIIIENLIVEEDRPEHIAKHNVTVDEVLEVIKGDYVFIKGKLERWILIGSTKQKRVLTVIVGQRKGKNTYGLITARPAHKTERHLYTNMKLMQGGDDDENN